MRKTIMSIELEGLKPFKKGKVRDVFESGDKLLFVASDRISAFDVVMPNGIPDKGKVLTQISIFWFEFTKDIIKNHLIASDIDEIVGYDEKIGAYKDILEKRSMLVEKSQPLPVECVVRGYLAGSGWREYQEKQSICGIELPPGLKESDKLPEPIFTPSTKAETGHDESITKDETIDLIGDKLFGFVSSKSIEIYKKADDFARSKGIIIADTKFEFGKKADEIILIDEVLTPDSSRFWPLNEYKAGRPQRSYDKQFTRDYLDSLDWDKVSPGPVLPDEIVNKTREKYLSILSLITGKTL
ncbi:MAG: phosphoribosylaminoimidazolesuccinocarboxamide synthase [Candidatus Omnitrophica bacterium]|nr:phosphoribosylaminoimidazolesuccinocarboxamide synthase [Candidatus Omnitrophota bacterium]